MHDDGVLTLGDVRTCSLSLIHELHSLLPKLRSREAAEAKNTKYKNLKKKKEEVVVTGMVMLYVIVES